MVRQLARSPPLICRAGMILWYNEDCSFSWLHLAFPNRLHTRTQARRSYLYTERAFSDKLELNRKR
ncbi:MAG: hypothetical protein JWR03_652 [Cohnella sp.]|nr:hypothetical protein [Cohnella sp.]